MLAIATWHPLSLVLLGMAAGGFAGLVAGSLLSDRWWRARVRAGAVA